MGLGLIYGSLHLEPGDEIVSTTHDHYSTQMSLKHRADRTGATIREVSLYASPESVSEREVVMRMRNAITDQTRVLAVTWVHSSTGVKLPLAAMAAALGEINASREPQHRVLFCVDGVHGFGIENVTIDELGCDFFMAGTHKWIFGPRGTGVIWGRPEAWTRAKPVIPSFGPNYEVWLGGMTADQVPIGDLMTPGGFHSFEHRWALDEAFRFHLTIGKARVQERIHSLNTLAKDGLAAMPHVKLHTPRSAELSSGIICFEVDGLRPDDVVSKLREKGIIASSSPYRVSYPRIAPSLINNEAEVERTLQAIRAMA
jgi:selenocysteine lyase/cysteine desulfurase